jgi:hypothetical protein
VAGSAPTTPPSERPAIKGGRHVLSFRESGHPDHDIGYLYIIVFIDKNRPF